MTEQTLRNSRLGPVLILLGGFMFVPDTTISKGFWSIAIGLTFLGLNAARYFNGIRMSSFTTFLGFLSVVGGIIQLLGWKSFDGAFLLIILGAYLPVGPRSGDWEAQPLPAAELPARARLARQRARTYLDKALVLPAPGFPWDLASVFRKDSPLGGRAKNWNQRLARFHKGAQKALGLGQRQSFTEKLE